MRRSLATTRRAAVARQPVHTIYVPADRVTPWAWSRTSGLPLAPRSTRTLPTPPPWRERSTPTPTGSPRSGRCCARSSTASRSRTCGSTSRTATAGTPTTEEDAHAVAAVDAPWRRDPPPFWGCGSSRSRRRPGARAAHPRPGPGRRAGVGPPAGRLRLTLPKVTLGRAGAAMVDGLRAAGDGVRPGRPAGCASRSRSRPRRPCSAPTGRPRWPG